VALDHVSEAVNFCTLYGQEFHTGLCCKYVKPISTGARRS